MTKFIKLEPSLNIFSVLESGSVRFSCISCFIHYYIPFVSAGAGDLSFICLYLFIRLLSKPNPYFVKERNNKLYSRLLVFMFPAMLNYV